MDNQLPVSAVEDRTQSGASERRNASDQLLAHLHSAEYSTFMARVSSWQRLQYAAWPILIGAVALVVRIDSIPPQYRWWAALTSFLLVYVAYQGTMVDMLFSVLFIERDLRPRVGELVDTEDFWIYERVRERSFPSNPAWSMWWPIVIAFSVIGLVSGAVYSWYKPHWLDWVFFVIALTLGVFVSILTRMPCELRGHVKACTPEVGLKARSDKTTS